MVYTNRFRVFSAFFCLLLINGCAGLKLQPNDEPVEISADGSILQAMPDPYLSQSINIEPEAKAQFKTALTLMDKNDWQGAEQHFSAMTIAYPTLSGPFVNLGIALWKQNKLEQASTAFNQAMEVNGLNGDAYLQFALMLREQGQFTDAETLYLHAIKIWPHNLQAHINLGILYDMYMGQFANAVEHYKMAQSLQSEPDKKLTGWILDTQRRLPKEPEPKVETQDKQTDSEAEAQ